MYLEVALSGGKLWRHKYRFGGKEKRLALGAYPVLGLADARDRRDEARKLALQAQAGATFAAVMGLWFEKWKTEVSESTAESQKDRLKKRILPHLGDMPIAEIDAPTLLRALKPLEQRGTGDTPCARRKASSA